MQFELDSAEETEALGAALWQALPQTCLIFLYGELGAGKTTLVRGLLRAAGYDAAVKSPTFSLVEEYDLRSGFVFHFDLYRLKNPEELEWMGINDYMQRPALCLIEWPEMGLGYLPAPDFEIRLSYLDGKRLVDLRCLQRVLQSPLKLNWKNSYILL